MKGTVVFDFDYTLLDTTEFKRAVAAAGAACGVPPERFWNRTSLRTAGLEIGISTLNPTLTPWRAPSFVIVTACRAQ